MGRPHVLQFWVAVLVVLSCILDTSAEGQGKGKGKVKNLDAASTHYFLLPQVNNTEQERVLCLARGRCFLKFLQCPTQCARRKPRRNRKVKGCFIDCSSKCETTCKRKKASLPSFPRQHHQYYSQQQYQQVYQPSSSKTLMRTFKRLHPHKNSSLI